MSFAIASTYKMKDVVYKFKKLQHGKYFCSKGEGMNLKTEKIMPALTATLITIASFSYAEEAELMDRIEAPDGMMMGANEINAPSARLYWMDTTGKMHVDTGAIFDAELLIWKANCDDVEVGVFNELFPQIAQLPRPDFKASSFTDANYDHMDFDWNVGVRVGLGYYFEWDNWDIYGAWTHIHNKAHHNFIFAAGIESSFLLKSFSANWSSMPANLSLNGIANNADLIVSQAEHSHWKLKLDLIDVELGRLFFAGKWLTIRPKAGLRGGYVKQHTEIDYESVLINVNDEAITVIPLDEIKMKNDFSGIGVRGGIDTEWHFGDSDVFLYGDGAISLLYGRYHLSALETDTFSRLAVASDIILSTKDNFNDTKAITDLALGLSWRPDITWCCRTMRLTLGAGWEHHLFLNQFQLKRVFTVHSISATTDNPSTQNWTDYTRENGDLSTQGVTITALFEF